ncbi:MAG TPA: DUF1707 domain-containing protein [Marmoricola sp.]
MTAPSTRARQADRDAVLGQLEAAYADGQLDRAEFDRRSDRALRARTLGDLGVLVADLQSDGQPALRRAGSASAPVSRRMIALAAVIVVAAGLIVTKIADGHDDAPPSPPAAVQQPAVDDAAPAEKEELATAPLPEPLSLQAFRAFRTAYRERFGTTKLYEPTFHANGDVHFSVPYGPVGKNRIDPMFWSPKDGFDEWADPSTNVFDEGIVDLARVDLAALARNAVHARKYLNVENATVMITIERDPDLRPQVQVRFNASNSLDESGWMATTLSGRELASNPFSPDRR